MMVDVIHFAHLISFLEWCLHLHDYVYAKKSASSFDRIRFFYYHTQSRIMKNKQTVNQKNKIIEIEEMKT